MPGPILHVGATVMCAHGGQATPTAPVGRVMVSGQMVATIAAPYAVAGCGLTGAPSGPCATGQWVVGATRVFALGQALAIQSGVSVCAPTGSPMSPVAAQARVLAT
ncbi:hypothetical protein CR51_41430 [Caballeronia megalochromosomata]|nr:hypothetical protein CR51_41430 [Caballeronia megalochromosomata]